MASIGTQRVEVLNVLFLFGFYNNREIAGVACKHKDVSSIINDNKDHVLSLLSL